MQNTLQFVCFSLIQIIIPLYVKRMCLQSFLIYIYWSTPHCPGKKSSALKDGGSFSNFHIKLLYDGRLLFSLLELIKHVLTKI